MKIPAKPADVIPVGIMHILDDDLWKQKSKTSAMILPFHFLYVTLHNYFKL